MSDRCNTQKKINKLFKEFTKNIHTINFNDLSQIEKAKMVEVNQFFSGLGYLVGLADQAEVCWKTLENIIHKDRSGFNSSWMLLKW